MKICSKIPVGLIFFITLSVFFIACESDDLCEHSVNTPRLVLRFYDTNSKTTIKRVDNLIVYGEGQNTILTNTTTDSIALPLKVGTTTTTYVMIENAEFDATSGTITSGNVATVTFTYGVEEEFVSKACGFKILYNALKVSVENSDSSWIKSINIKNTNIKNESSAQVQFYH